MKKGKRVAAILTANEKTVSLLGFGTYVGDEVPDENAVGVLAEALRECSARNPKIELDNGDVVWGCECWWGDEKIVKAKFADREIIPVDINKVRADHYAQV